MVIQKVKKRLKAKDDPKFLTIKPYDHQTGYLASPEFKQIQDLKLTKGISQFNGVPPVPENISSPEKSISFNKSKIS